MQTIGNGIKQFFGVVVKSQTYLNMLYLFLAFPLGVFYFVFLVTGISVGIPLVLLWIGLFVLLGTIVGWYGLTAFERKMAIGLLNVQIPPMQPEDQTGLSLWARLKNLLKNSVTWKGLVYLLAKFPLGVFSFTVLTVFLSLSVALITAPVYYQSFHPAIDLTVEGITLTNYWLVDTLGKAWVCTGIGIFFMILSMHLFNGISWVYGWFARVMLGNSKSTLSVGSTIIQPPTEMVEG